MVGSWAASKVVQMALRLAEKLTGYLVEMKAVQTAWTWVESLVG